jgi:methyl-accepting chemotaxis protein
MVGHAHQRIEAPAEVVAALNALAAGDTNATATVHNDDEIGQVAKAFGVFKEKSLEMRRMEEEKREADQKAEEERRDAVAREETRKQEDRDTSAGRKKAGYPSDGG